MDALKRSLASEKQSAPPAQGQGQEAAQGRPGQREMLLPICRQARKGSAEEGGATGAHGRPIEKSGIMRRASRRRRFLPPLNGK